MKDRSPILYHFTCDDHGYPGIVRTGTVLPRQHPFMPGLGPLLWLTDLAEPPTPESVGLTSQNLKCDRLAVGGQRRCSAPRRDRFTDGRKAPAELCEHLDEIRSEPLVSDLPVIVEAECQHE